MSSIYTASLVIVPAVVGIIVLLLLRPRTPAATKPILDLGGMALVEILRKLDEAISQLENLPQDTDNKALSNTIVIMARSALCAYTQSMEWRKTLNLGIDPVISKSLSENLLDALKLLDIGSSSWVELKTEMDIFHRYVLAGVAGAGGSTPPTPMAST